MTEKPKRSKSSKRTRRPYMKPEFKSARFAERRALACAKVEGQGQEGCGVSYYS